MSRQTFFVLVPILILALSSCGVPERWVDRSATNEVDTRYKTVSALLTQTVQQEQTQTLQSLPSITPSPTASTRQGTYTLSPSPTIDKTVTDTPQQRTATTAVVAQAAKTPTCDLAQAGRPIDVTIPDDTRVRPGEAFSKTWRLVNAGSCAWDESYAVVWFSGADIGANRTQNLPAFVPMGKSVDVTVDMVAPSAPGSYQSNWKLSNTAGALFGIGPAGDAPFWVRIIVVPEATPTPGESIPTDLPTGAPTATPALYLSGVAVILPGHGLNLDTGLNDPGTHADLRLDWLEEAGAQAWLLSVNGARMAEMGTVPPSQSQCIDANMNDAPILVESITPGLFFCARTNEGLPGRILIAAVDGAARQVTVDFIIWAVP